MSTNAQDYLMRYFSQLGKVLSALMGMHEKKDYQQAIDQIQQIFVTWFDEDVEEFEKISDAQLAQRLENPSTYFEQEKAMAELLYQRALILIKMEKPGMAVHPARVALQLFKKIDETSGDFSLDLQHKIAELDAWTKL